MDRREVLKVGLSGCAMLAAKGAAAAVDPAIPIIDTHIHLFDTAGPREFHGRKKVTLSCTSRLCRIDTSEWPLRSAW